MIDVARDDKQFRRGVVLGLTMAEIMLLLLFLLMLLLVGKLFDERKLSEQRDREFSEAQFILVDLKRRAAESNLKVVDVYSHLGAERDAAVVRVKELTAALDEIKQNSSGANFDITKDYVRVQRERNDALQKLSAMDLVVERIKEIQQKTPTLSEGEAAESFVELARIGQEILQQAQQVAPAASPDQAVAELQKRAALGGEVLDSGGDPSGLLTSAASCKQELQSCQGQTAFLNNRLNSQIGGRGKKPCWASLQGSIQFIFNAELRPEGIVVLDNKVPGRAEDQAKLPLENAVFGRPLSQGEFGSSYNALYNWSDANDCRFYVNLIDETGAAEKSIYKDMRRTVEGYFYIRDVR